MSVRTILERAISLARRSGTRAAADWAVYRLREKRGYERWVRTFGTLTDARRAVIRDEIGRMERHPLISVLLPVYNVDEKWLRLCIGSVTRQLYPHWELCIADDASPSPHVRAVLAEFTETDSRIKTVFRETNGNISAASNSALELVTGEFTVLLDHDDELSEDALFRVAKELIEHPEAVLIYSDEDKIDEQGRRSDPKFKPDFSRDLFYSLNQVTHLSAFRTMAIREAGGFRSEFDGSQDYDLALRVAERAGEHQIRHIPQILYHWRAIPGSVALDGDEKPYAHERARAALRGHLERTGKNADVTAAFGNMHRVRYHLSDPLPAVSVITFPEGVSELASRTSYQNVEFIASADGAAALGRAAAECSGEILCFVSSGLVPDDEDWLEELVRFASQDEIGVAGAKLLSDNRTVCGSGLLVGVGGTVSPAHYGLPEDAAGSMARNMLIGNYSAVSRACMAVRRDVFERLGGYDSEMFAGSLFDADLCLKAGQAGLRVVFTPYAVLRGSVRIHEPEEAEAHRFARKWAGTIRRDPFYNPNLSKADGRFMISLDAPTERE